MGVEHNNSTLVSGNRASVRRFFRTASVLLRMNKHHTCFNQTKTKPPFSFLLFCFCLFVFGYWIKLIALGPLCTVRHSVGVLLRMNKHRAFTIYMSDLFTHLSPCLVPRPSTRTYIWYYQTRWIATLPPYTYILSKRTLTNWFNQ